MPDGAITAPEPRLRDEDPEGQLLALREEERAQELSALRGDRVSAEWGNQIRSYVLHPYKSVKDHRTDHQMGNADAVLAGEIDGFIEAWLVSQLGAD
jgi:peptide chain release factor 2